MADSLSFLIRSAFDATGVNAAINSITKIDGQIAKVSKGLQKFTGLLAGGTAGAAIIAFLGKTYDSYKESEKAVNMLTRAFQNLGTFTQKEIQDQIDFADKLQKTTKYTDEQIIAIQTQLVTYGLYGEELKRATVATLDLAVKTGSTETAVKLLGKAYQGQTDTLAKYGLKIDANKTGSEKYAAVLAEVEKKLGGLAEAEAAALGPGDRLSKSLDTLYEKIGALVAGPLGDTLKLLTNILELLPQVSTAVYKGEIELAKTDGVLKSVFKSVWNNLNIFKLLGETVDTTTSKIMGIKKAPEPAISAKPGKPLWQPDVTDPEEIKKEAKRQTILKETEAFFLTERGKLYKAFFGEVEIDSRFAKLAQIKDADKLKAAQKEMLNDLERDYSNASMTFSGGFQQALLETQTNMYNWKAAWDSVIQGALGPAKQAIHDFFTMTSEGFLQIDKLAKSIFQGILNAFLDMLETMAAKAAIYGFFSLFGGGGLLGGFKKFVFGFQQGGAVPATGLYSLHAGEYVLSPDVVSAIKKGSPSEGLSALAAAGAGANINFSQSINIQGGANLNVQEICREITKATKQGISSAVEMSKVTYKMGTKRSNETGL